MQRGVSFTVPRTRAEASRLIDELRRRPADSAADRRRDVRAVQDAIATGRGDAARVREELEVTGYGRTVGGRIECTTSSSLGACIAMTTAVWRR